MKALFTGIFSLFTTGTPAIFTDVSGKLYLEEAPQNTAFPYIVYHLISNDYDFQFEEDYEEFILQFNIFDDDRSSSDIGGYFEHLKSLYDWSTPTVTGYRVESFTREFAQLARDDDVWQYSVQYRIRLEKN